LEADENSSSSEVSIPSRPTTPESTDSRLMLLELLLTRKQEELEQTKEELRVWKAALAEAEDKHTALFQQLKREKDLLVELLLKERLLRKHVSSRIRELESSSLEESRHVVRYQCHEEIKLRKEIERLELEREWIEPKRIVTKSDSSATMLSDSEQKEDESTKELTERIAYLENELQEAHQIIDLQHEKLVSKPRNSHDVRSELQGELGRLKGIAEPSVLKEIKRIEDLVMEQNKVIQTQEMQIFTLSEINREVKELLVASCVHQDHPSDLIIKYNDALLEIEKLKKLTL
jgi:cellobiose-specific phosphotransferase system component IIA